MTGILMDKWRDYAFIARSAIGLSTIPVLVSMLAWHFDVAPLVFVGVAFVGLFGFGTLPLSIEYGIEVTFDPRCPSMAATVSGIVQASTNIFGMIITIATTPGNIPGSDSKSIPLAWMTILILGGILLCSAPPTYKRLDHERAVSND